MPKLIALISKQPQLSHAEFREYYETQHAPLVRSLLPMIGRYTRSYLPTPAVVPGGGAADFDVLTELWFDDQAALDGFWQRIREPEVTRRIRADEANFLVGARTTMYEVVEAGGT